MSGGAQSVCPHCNSKEIDRGHQNKKICRNCNFVIDKSEKLDSSYLNIDNYNPDENEEPTDTDWEEVVTPQDSSEQILVDMIGKTESCILELDGTESDCVKGVELLTDAWQEGYFQGRSADVGIGAIVYITFRERKPRPLPIVAEVCEISTKKLRSGYRSLRSEYGISGDIVCSSAYIPFLSTELLLSRSVQKQAESLINSFTDITGNPTGIAAAALYLAARSSDEKITLAQAGDAAGVTKETVWHKTQEFESTNSSD